MPLDRRAQRLLAMLATASPPGEARETPAGRRQALVALAELADTADAPVSIADRDIPGPAGAIPIRIYAPLQAGWATGPGLVFFHGGGWVAGGLETHDGFCGRLAVAAGCRVIAVDYRLAPEHPFPAALDDALAATRWVAAHAAALGLDAARIAVGGDSVGAGLAAAVARTLRDARGPRLAAQVLVCPILDLGKADGSRADFADGYFISRGAFARDLADYLSAGVQADDPRLSPARAPDLAGLPPAIIHTAEFDPFRDEGEAYGWALERAGVTASTTRHAGMIHYFYAMARAIPYAAEAAELIGAEMRELLTQTAASPAIRPAVA